MLELTMWKCASHSENKDKINGMLAYAGINYVKVCIS